MIRENDELRPREAERRGGFGSQRVGSGRILLRQASPRRKIASNEPGIRGMSDQILLEREKINPRTMEHRRLQAGQALHSV